MTSLWEAFRGASRISRRREAAAFLSALQQAPGQSVPAGSDSPTGTSRGPAAEALPGELREEAQGFTLAFLAPCSTAVCFS